jgi:hypothetical protein
MTSPKPGADSPFEINCPCCGALIVLDAATRAVLRHEVPARHSASFEEMLKEVDLSKKRNESKLQRAMEEQDRRGEILEKKFREAIKKADSPDAKPPLKPFDLD